MSWAFIVELDVRGTGTTQDDSTRQSFQALPRLQDTLLNDDPSYLLQRAVYPPSTPAVHDIPSLLTTMLPQLRHFAMQRCSLRGVIPFLEGHRDIDEITLYYVPPEMNSSHVQDWLLI